MLNDGEDRRFKYAGANKGDLTVTFLFSNWGSGTRAINGTYAFSGGQFDGTYNNESRYLRQMNFTVPPEATSVEIVATITGHWVQQRHGKLCRILRPPTLLHDWRAPNIRVASHRLQQ